MSRSYRNYLNPAWAVYNLFDQKGLEASFLKEDISTLCIAASCDRYLSDQGRAVIVLRPATMKSDLTSRGLRRLSLFPGREFLRLREIREFSDIKVFGGASAPAASWNLTKGEKTEFPIPVRQWSRCVGRWQPNPTDPLEEVSKHIIETSLVCSPIDPKNNSSRWSIGSKAADRDRLKILGGNKYEPRIGFFTGGANSIYYMEHLKKVDSNLSFYRNITERAKKKTEEVTTELENDLIYEVVRGRDLSFWNAVSEVKVLCPHTRQTKMYPMEESLLRAGYPYAYNYLSKLKGTLEERNGFAGWEKKIHKNFYYTLQRIGEYTFAPYKVCWSYIANDFTIAVVGPDQRGMPMFPNDKVVFIPFENADAAYFVAGVLSSSPFRSAVVSSVTSRQVSASVIKHYNIPEFDSENNIHNKISALCKKGHFAIGSNSMKQAVLLHEELDYLASGMFGFSSEQALSFRKSIYEHLGYFPFKNTHHIQGLDKDQSQKVA